MTTMTIKLPAELKAFVEEAVAKEPNADASRFIADLVRAERRRRAEEYLIQLVKEADESGPATPMTRKDWDNLKRRAHERLAKAKAAANTKGRKAPGDRKGVR